MKFLAEFLADPGDDGPPQPGDGSPTGPPPREGGTPASPRHRAAPAPRGTTKRSPVVAGKSSAPVPTKLTKPGSVSFVSSAPSPSNRPRASGARTPRARRPSPDLEKDLPDFDAPGWTGEKPRPWRCFGPFCRHKERWWLSVYGKIFCRNCVTPAHPGLVKAEGDASDAPLVHPERLTEPFGYDLRLMSSVKDVSKIPTAGKRLVIVAAKGPVLCFRIFADDGKMVEDTDSTQRTAEAPQIEDLRKQLENLWPPHKLTTSEKVRVINAVTSIVGHTSPFDEGTDPARH
jgi:hypothetical protein